MNNPLNTAVRVAHATIIYSSYYYIIIGSTNGMFSISGIGVSYTRESVYNTLYITPGVLNLNLMNASLELVMTRTSVRVFNVLK